MKKCNTVWKLTNIYLILNFGINFYKYITGEDKNLTPFLLSLLNLNLLTFANFWIFYRGYRSAAHDNSLFKIYFRLEIVALVYYFIAFKYKIWGFNGLNSLDVALKDKDIYLFFSVCFLNLFLFWILFLRVGCLIIVINWKTKSTEDILDDSMSSVVALTGGN